MAFKVLGHIDSLPYQYAPQKGPSTSIPLLKMLSFSTEDAKYLLLRFLGSSEWVYKLFLFLLKHVLVTSLHVDSSQAWSEHQLARRALEVLAGTSSSTSIKARDISSCIQNLDFIMVHKSEEKSDGPSHPTKDMNQDDDGLPDPSNHKDKDKESIHQQEGSDTSASVPWQKRKDAVLRIVRLIQEIGETKCVTP